MNQRARDLVISFGVAFLMISCVTLPAGERTIQATPIRKPPPERVQAGNAAPLEGPPILQIDTGGHKAIIRDVIFTKDGRYLVSASDDKTVRVWDVRTGDIERYIRGQIGKGHEGGIYAAALSPDNRWLAVGGYPSKWGIRLIDFATGRVRRLLEGHENVIFGLAFSRDSRLLISGSADDTARLWDTATGTSLHTLRGHKDHIYAVAFSPDGRLAVTGSFDHTLRLWRVSDGSLVRTLAGHEDKVKSVAFTPDGKYLLSGSYDNTIRLWDGVSGRFIKVLARQNRNLASLSITPDSKHVLTGSGQTRSGQFTNNVFSIPDGDRIAQFDKHANIVLATAISPDGATAATGGAEEEIWLWDIETGREKRKLAGQGRQVWSVGFSKDGRSIAWGNSTKSNWTMNHYGPLEKSFIIRSETGDFGPGPELSSDDGYVRALETKDQLSIRTPDGRVHPTLQILKDGQVVHEITRGSTDGYTHRSLTLTPDNSTVISGGENGELTAYDTQTGRKRHDFIGHTGDVWGVAVSPDGRYLVSGAADQTARLWEAASGRALMTLFYGSDGEWVAWTEEGFYAASPGGEKYVGYHLNRGADRAADYVRVEQVGKLFYRPDLVAKKIQGGFEDEIRAELARIGDIDRVIASGLPPKVRILTEPAALLHRTDLDLEIEIEDQGGGIGPIEYRLNGTVLELPEKVRDYAKGRANRVNRFKLRLPVTLVDGRNEIEVKAENRSGQIVSTPARLIQQARDPLAGEPSLYVLAIGISRYYDSALDLAFAHNDAQEIAAQLQRRGRGLFKSVHLTTLVNEQAKTETIREKFRKLGNKIQRSDVFVLYLAGHGITEQGNYHFLPWELDYGNRQMLIEGSLSSEVLTELLKGIPALKTLVILDTCYAAAYGEEANLIAYLSRGNIEQKTAIDRLMRATGRAFIAASRRQAIEGYENHGVFTHALLKGLKGKADHPGEGYGTINISELAEFVRGTVPGITNQRYGYRQVPMFMMFGDPFPIGCQEGFDGVGCRRNP
jgi:WD40 repeat protein